MITIKYFGILAEITNCEEENIDFTGHTIGELKTMILKKYPKMKVLEFQIAHDQNIVSEDEILNTSEVAFLPPFAGG